jgi:hypothetical protein
MQKSVAEDTVANASFIITVAPNEGCSLWYLISLNI